MFAIDHAATALLLKRRYPRVPTAALLLSVQLPELFWVAFTLLGVERVSTASAVHTVADIHLSFMPYSHSVATMLGGAVLVGCALWAPTRRKDLAVAVGLGIASHLVLDLLTHEADLALAPGLTHVRLGLGLYSAAPAAAFALELVYGWFCVWVYRGGKGLWTTVTLFNLANLSMFFTAIPGPEEWMPGRPALLVGVVAAQIAVTLACVGWLSRSSHPEVRPATALGAGTSAPR